MVARLNMPTGYFARPPSYPIFIQMVFKIPVINVDVHAYAELKAVRTLIS